MSTWMPCFDNTTMPARIVLATLNAKYIHASLGLRYLMANMARHGGSDLAAMTSLQEFTIQRPAQQIVDALLQTLEEAVTGDFYEEYKSYNYYTAQLYASLFFTKDSVCNETNILGNEQFSTIDKSGIEKHKEQLKMLFFNPGKRIGGIPFMSGKTAIFDNDVAENYDMSIDADIYNHTNCLVFKQKRSAIPAFVRVCLL